MSAASDFDEGSVMSRWGFEESRVVRRINPDEKWLSRAEQRVNEAETLR